MNRLACAYVSLWFLAAAPATSFFGQKVFGKGFGITSIGTYHAINFIIDIVISIGIGNTERQVQKLALLMPNRLPRLRGGVQTGVRYSIARGPRNPRSPVASFFCHRVNMVNRVDKVNRVDRVNRVNRVNMVNRVNRVNKVNKVNKVKNT